VRACPLVVAVVLLGASGAHANPDYVPGQVLVRLRAGPGGKTVDLASVVGRSMRTVRPRLTRVAERASLIELDGAGKADTLAAVSALRADPDVAWAEPNYLRRMDMLPPNDERIAQQWALPKGRLYDAWDRTLGATSTVVAVIDSGIMPHPDLAGRLLPGYDFITDPASAADGNGRDADPADAGTEAPTSTGFHGTHVAGIIAAKPGNGTGIAGIDWNCKVLPIRALGVERGTGTDLDITDAMLWAAGLPVPGAPSNANPARIINLSFGGAGTSQLVIDTVTELRRRGIIIIASAGNDNVNAGGYTPAGVPGLITVGAARYDGARAPYSNFGASVELMAPGGDLTLDQDRDGNPDGILSLTFSRQQNAFGYVYYQGTSQAAPQVSGIVSLMLALDPALTPARAEQLLMETANPASQCGEGCGAGLVDANAVLLRLTGAPPSPDPVPVPVPDPIDPGPEPPRPTPGSPTEYYGGCNLAPGGPTDSAATPLVLLLLACGLALTLRRRGR